MTSREEASSVSGLYYRHDNSNLKYAKDPFCYRDDFCTVKTDIRRPKVEKKLPTYWMSRSFAYGMSE